MIRRPPRSTQSRSSAASDVYKRQIQVHTPGGGGVVLDTADDGGVVGWSWLVPPYRWMFDARASESTSAVAFDGACLRGKCENDPVVGYALMQRVTQVMFDRLE